MYVNTKPYFFLTIFISYHYINFILEIILFFYNKNPKNNAKITRLRFLNLKLLIFNYKHCAILNPTFFNNIKN